MDYQHHGAGNRGMASGVAHIMELLIISFLGLVAWLWYDAGQAKEVATLGAKLRCDSRGVLMLDQTVVLTRMRLRRARSGQLRPHYNYSFEFTTSGDDRNEGQITVMAGRVLTSTFSDTQGSTIEQLH